MIDFIEVLKAQQSRAQLTQAEFAGELQISESYLSLLYNRKRRPGVLLLSQVRKRYPHLASEIDLYLLEPDSSERTHA